MKKCYDFNEDWLDMLESMDQDFWDGETPLDDLLYTLWEERDTPCLRNILKTLVTIRQSEQPTDDLYRRYWPDALGGIIMPPMAFLDLCQSIETSLTEYLRTHPFQTEKKYGKATYHVKGT